MVSRVKQMLCKCEALRLGSQHDVKGRPDNAGL